MELKEKILKDVVLNEEKSFVINSLKKTIDKLEMLYHTKIRKKVERPKK